MLKEDAVAFFGSRKNIQKILGLSNSAVYRWGQIVPKSSAGRLYHLSNHRVPFRPEDYEKRKGGDK